MLKDVGTIKDAFSAMRPPPFSTLAFQETTVRNESGRPESLGSGENEAHKSTNERKEILHSPGALSLPKRKEARIKREENLLQTTSVRREPRGGSAPLGPSEIDSRGPNHSTPIDQHTGGFR